MNHIIADEECDCKFVPTSDGNMRWEKCPIHQAAFVLLDACVVARDLTDSLVRTASGANIFDVDSRLKKALSGIPKQEN